MKRGKEDKCSGNGHKGVVPRKYKIGQGWDECREEAVKGENRTEGVKREGAVEEKRRRRGGRMRRKERNSIVKHKK